MIHARENDFEKVKSIFKQHKEWFGFVRTDYIQRTLMNNADKFNYERPYNVKHSSNNYLIFEDDVVITYSINKVKHKLCRLPNISDVNTYKDDVILHQIGAKNRNGSASKVLQKFFKEHRRVFLSVHSSNKIAKKFYKKNGMSLVGHTTFAKATIPGDIYFHDNLEGIF
jgi:hypothetical protein